MDKNKTQTFTYSEVLSAVIVGLDEFYETFIDDEIDKSTLAMMKLGILSSICKNLDK